MNNETQRIMEALVLIYGSDLQAATITVLLKDGDTSVRFITTTFPQRETEKCCAIEAKLKEKNHV
jgi:hypothetical protein